MTALAYGHKRPNEAWRLFLAYEKAWAGFTGCDPRLRVKRLEEIDAARKKLADALRPEGE